MNLAASAQPVLIHPARLRPAIGLVQVCLIRGHVVAVLVELNLAVMLAHVDLKLLRRLLAPPAVVRVTRAEVTFRKAEQETAARHEFHVNETEEQSAQMSKVGDSTLGRLEGCDHDHKDNNAHQVFRFDRERKRKQKVFSVTVKHSEGDQQAVYPARSADRRDRRRDSGKSRISYRYRDQRGPDNTEEIEFKKLARTPVLLFLRSEHPERQHIEKQVAQATM